MKAKSIRKLTVLAFALLALNSFGSETVQLRIPASPSNPAGGPDRYSDRSITLEEGDSAELLYANPGARLSVTIEGEEVKLPWFTTVGSGTQILENSPVIAGPATIRLFGGYSDTMLFATVRVKRGGTPSGTILVPEDDPDAVFEVFMEASTDMQTWVRVIPGDYSADGAARFFRVRMVKK